MPGASPKRSLIAQDMSPSKVFLMKHLEEADAEDGTQDGGLLMLNTSLKSLGNCDPPLELVIPPKPPSNYL